MGRKGFVITLPRPEEMSATDSMSLENTFQKKYDEFIVDLRQTFPELSTELAAAAAIPELDRLARYHEQVVAKHAELNENIVCPGIVLPGVRITDALWAAVGHKTKAAVYEYLSILDLCAMYEHGLDGEDMGKFQEWADRVTKNWRSRLDKVDFESLADKFKDMFGGTNALPKMPEKFLKGKLAKLAEDMVREFKPEDFGLRPEDLEAVERDPARAFEILMQASSSNPEMLQKAMMRVGKKLQEKIQRGELRPQELAAEAEELMQEFQSHPAFAEMMKSFKSAFSFDDPEKARASGQDNEGRLAMVRNRLKKKLEAKRAAGK